MMRFFRCLWGLYRYLIGRPVHCWAGKADQHEFGSDKWAEAYENDGTCFRLSGHFGAHRFTPDADVLVTFEGRTNGR